MTKHYGGVTALNGVTLAVGAGQICGLIGPNGAGKTTLFDVLSGVQEPTSGDVRIGDVVVTRRSPTWRARHGLRRTFQRQQPFHWLSVEDNLLVALEWHGGGGGFLADILAPRSRQRIEDGRRDAVRAALEKVGLSDFASRMPATLTIGQLRLVELARAMVDGPSVVLLDEPTSGLSPAEARTLGGAVLEVRARTGCSFVLVEHDVQFVMDHCDWVVVMDVGQVLAEGRPEDVRHDPAVVAAYLGDVS